MKKIFAFILVCALFLAFSAVACADLYALVGVVIEVDYLNNTVTFEDFNGNEWAFEGVEDWEVDDICGAVMFDNNTPTIYDDIILSTRYNGYI